MLSGFQQALQVRKNKAWLTAEVAVATFVKSSVSVKDSRLKNRFKDVKYDESKKQTRSLTR